MAGRSIPACTGKPTTHDRLGAAPEVYPRVYGETRLTSKMPCSSGGLSPRVRGNPAPQSGAALMVWSIPACTGKPLDTGVRAWLTAVYPRVYGETAYPVHRLW